MLASPVELQYFLEVASTGNLSRAAERLGVSQPTLSVAMRRLEENFGVALMVRTKSGVTLTHAGIKLQRNAQNLVIEWERLKGDAAKDESELRGSYTLGCHPSVGLFTLPEFVPKLIAEYPKLELRLHHDLSRKIAEDVVSFKLDFGIVVNPMSHPDLIIRSLYRDEVSLYRGPQKTPQQTLESGDTVLISPPSLMHSKELLSKMEQKKLHFDRVITSSNLEVVAELVAAGVGIGILPERVAKHRAHQRLRKISPKAPTIPDSHALVYRADMQRSVASKTLGRFIEQELKRAFAENTSSLPQHNDKNASVQVHA